MPEFVGVEEAAQELGIAPYKLRRLIRGGIITADKRIGQMYLLTRDEVNRAKHLGAGKDMRRVGTASVKDIKG
jgi:excisionase family DNA binding protein